MRSIKSDITIVNVILIATLILFPDKGLDLYLGFLLLFLFGFFHTRNKSRGLVVRNCLLVVLPYMIACILFPLGFYHLWQFDNEILNAIVIHLAFFLIASISGYASGALIRKYIKNDDYRNVIAVSVVIFFITMLPGAFSWSLRFSAAGIGYAVGGYFSASCKNSNNRIRIILLFSPFLLFIAIAFSSDIILHFPTCIVAPLGVLVGYGLKNLYNKNQWAASIFFGVLYITFMIAGYFGMANWIEYARSLKYSSSISTQLNYRFVDERGDMVTNNTLKDRTVLFYFWTTTCSVCFDKFPELEELYIRFSEAPKVDIYAVNINVRRSDKDISVHQMIRDRGYSFPVLVVPFETRDITIDEFGIVSFPHSTIINNNGTIVHNGQFNNEQTLFINNAGRILTGLLENR